jgi:hypothetical protein
MVDELDEQEQLEQPTDDGALLSLDELSVGVDDVTVGKSLSEEEEDTERKTDLQAAMKALLPRYSDPRLNELLQPAMVSRIFPDNYLDKNFLLVMSVIEEREGEDDIDVVGIISKVQDGTSIGYEGRGRVDILEIAGVAHEEELQKLSKELGF